MTSRKLRSVALFITLSLGLTAGLGKLEADTDVVALERLAEERYAEGDLKRAAELYREIAGQQTTSRARSEALFTASWLRHLSGNPSLALESMTEALKLDPEHPFDASLYNREFELLFEQALNVALRERQRDAEGRIRAAQAELDAGREPQARALLEAALELAPEHPTALYHLAVLDLEDGATREAMEELERLVALTHNESNPSMRELRARALARLGAAYLEQDRPDDAEQALLEATRANPLEATAWKHLGLLHSRRQDYAAATPLLERAHELLPDDRVITLALTRALVEEGRAGQAAATLESDLLRAPDDAQLWLELGRIEHGRGELGKATYAFEKSVAADAENRSGVAVAAVGHLAEIHLEREEPEQAIEVANGALGWDRSDPALWSALGQAQLAAGQEANAVASLTRASELDPSDASTLLLLGNALTANRQLQQAEAVYQRALALDPSSGEASSQLAAVRRELDNERAIVAGKVRPRKSVPPKKIGLDFAGIDYKDLHLRGALVKQVNKKSPAARAGLRKGDLILWIGDYAVLSDKDFFQYLKRNPPREVLEIEYLRDGRIFETDIQLR